MVERLLSPDMIERFQRLQLRELAQQNGEFFFFSHVINVQGYQVVKCFNVQCFQGSSNQGVKELNSGSRL